VSDLTASIAAKTDSSAPAFVRQILRAVIKCRNAVPYLDGGSLLLRVCSE
jgi:hypothetical protein